MGEIHKLTKDGKTLFPATTTDAVVHPQVRAAISSLMFRFLSPQGHFGTFPPIDWRKSDQPPHTRQVISRLPIG